MTRRPYRLSCPYCSVDVDLDVESIRWVQDLDVVRAEVQFVSYHRCASPPR